MVLLSLYSFDGTFVIANKKINRIKCGKYKKKVYICNIDYLCSLRLKLEKPLLGYYYTRIITNNSNINF